MDYGRYAKFEDFLFTMGAVPAKTPVSRLTMDVTAP
jgi:hypothetical protein